MIVTIVHASGTHSLAGGASRAESYQTAVDFIKDKLDSWVKVDVLIEGQPLTAAQRDNFYWVLVMALWNSLYEHDPEFGDRLAARESESVQ